MIYLQSDVLYLVSNVKVIVSVLPCYAEAVFLSPPLPPVWSLVVTELWVLFISPHHHFSLQSLHSSSGFLLFWLPLTVVNYCSDVALSCTFTPSLQPLSKNVCASVVNTSPFSHFKALKTSGCTKAGFSRDRWKIWLSLICPSTLLCPLSPLFCPHLHHLYSIRVAILLRTAGCERVNSWLEFMLSPSPICSVEWEITFSMRIIEHGQGGASSLPTNHREQGHLSRRQ